MLATGPQVIPQSGSRGPPEAPTGRSSPLGLSGKAFGIAKPSSTGGRERRDRHPGQKNVTTVPFRVLIFEFTVSKIELLRTKTNIRRGQLPRLEGGSYSG